MEDFLVLTANTVEALRIHELASRVSDRLGIGRIEKKGLREPTQLTEHLGMEVNLAAGQFCVTLRRTTLVPKRFSTKHLSKDARLPERRLAGYTCLCQSLYLAVPPVRLYLRGRVLLRPPYQAGVGLEGEAHEAGMGRGGVVFASTGPEPVALSSMNRQEHPKAILSCVKRPSHWKAISACTSIFKSPKCEDRD
ncbi:hypothetical protein CYMTET_22111 [Cymbomonas tetramitiformis]|uniref:Reverse transcriptase domain-containing protein n=1 Tax=Cymbomonas tetramitiformis TaxID=36881 RepID=A0AAE0L2L9_9CHLO|nr:hypothetical protein CYMTET_22111 [Cymbomonas tetramitiformis]